MSPTRASTLPPPLRRIREAIRKLASADLRGAVIRKVRRIGRAERLGGRIERLDPYAVSTDRAAIQAVRIFVEASVDGRVRDRRGRAKRTVEKSLALAIPRGPEAIKTTLWSCARAVDRSPDRFEEASARLVELLEATDPTAASSHEWLRLRFVLVGHGFVEASATVRELAHQSALARVEGDVGHRARRGGARDTEDPDGEVPSDDELLLAGFLCLDAGDADRATSIHEQLMDRQVHSVWMQELATSIALATNDHRRFAELAEQRRGPEDDEMLELIRGRSVAVVGPSPTDAEHGDVIEAHDVVVRLTYTGRDTIGSAETAGRRTDVAYYRRPYYVRPVLETIGDQVVLPTDLQLAVIERDTSPYAGVPTRLGFKPAAPGIFGIKDTRYQKLQFAVYDLLHFEPAHVTIFNTTFYLSADLYHPGFASPRVSNAQPVDLCGQFARHDPIGNREFVRRVLAAYGVEADDEAARVLAMPTRAYARGLDTLFGAGRWQG